MRTYVACCMLALYGGCADNGTQQCIDNGTCTAASCGNGRLEPGEICDDANKLDSDGCSADCRSLDGLFLVTPPIVRFTAVEGDAPPDAVTVRVQLDHATDTVIAGFGPGVAQPGWLSIAEGLTSETSAEFRLQVIDTPVVGTHSTTVRLLLGHWSSPRSRMFDLPVIYDVAASDLAVQATPAMLAFTAITGEEAPSQTIDVTFDGNEVSVVSVPAWAAVSSSATTTPFSFAVTITDTWFAAGTLLSGDIVVRTTRGTSQRTTSVHVTCHIEAQPELTVEPTPTRLAFTAFSHGAVPPPQSVHVAFNGESIAILSVPSWVTVSPLSSTNPTTLTVSVNDTAFPGETTRSEAILFRTTRGEMQSVARVDLNYDILIAPEIQFVTPYVGVAGRPGSLRLRGHGFRSTSPRVTIGIGDVRLGPLVTEGDTQITVSYPGLPAGRYQVSVVDPPGISLLAPELVIIAPPAFGYQAIDAPSRRTRIVYDAERGAIYGVNKLDQQLEHFVYADGAWSTRSPHIIPRLTDVAMAPNGRSLIVIDPDHVGEMSLTDDLFVPVARRGSPMDHLDGLCDQAAATDNGTFVLRVGAPSCERTLLYDMVDQSLEGGEWPYTAARVVGASMDGSRIYWGSTDQEWASMQIFESLSNTRQFASIHSHLNAISVGGNASRLIVNHSDVYSRALTLLGRIPMQGGVTHVSRDSRRAYVYLEDTAGPRVQIYNLDVPAQAGIYPLLETVQLGDAANGDGPYGVTMTTSLDDTALFISGPRRLLVVPVH